MAENFEQTANALFKGAENYLTTKTVVGEAVQVGDATILPICDVTFGMVASSKSQPQSHGGNGGVGGKVEPTALLIIKDGMTRLINIKDKDTVSRLVGMVPDIVSYFRSGKMDDDLKEAVDDAASKKETF